MLLTDPVVPVLVVVRVSVVEQLPDGVGLEDVVGEWDEERL